MPGVESFEITDEKHWSAKVKVPLGLGGLKMTMNFEKLEEREPEFASMRAKGQGVGALMDMTTSFTLSEAGDWNVDGLGGGREDRGSRRRDGPAGAAADRQPAGLTGARGARAARRGRLFLTMPPPFRVGVMQLTMEPLEEMLESARVMDRAGMDTIWLAEAYPWWRKHGMEARSSTVVSALMARETEQLTIGWGIISPFTRHPVQVAMDARVVQEAAGPGRFLLGFGTSKIFLNNIRSQTSKTLGPMRDAVTIVRGVLGGEPFEYEGDTWSASVPGLSADADTPRGVPPVYVAATAPKMQALAGEIARRVPDAVDHHAPVRPLHARERRGGHRHRLHGRGVDRRVGPRRGPRRREGDRGHVPREQVPEHPRLGGHAARARGDRDGGARAGRRGDGAGRTARGEGRGHRLAARPLQAHRGTPADCIAAIEEYREAGCTHVMLELWGDRRHDQIRLFGEKVLPQVRG